MEANDIPKTVFITRKGLFQFRVLPVWLCNATVTFFERLMKTVLAGFQWDICTEYLDDIWMISLLSEEVCGKSDSSVGKDWLKSIKTDSRQW